MDGRKFRVELLMLFFFKKSAKLVSHTVYKTKLNKFDGQAKQYNLTY